MPLWPPYVKTRTLGILVTQCSYPHLGPEMMRVVGHRKAPQRAKVAELTHRSPHRALSHPQLRQAVKAFGSGDQREGNENRAEFRTGKQPQHAFLCVPRAVTKARLIHGSVHSSGHSPFLHCFSCSQCPQQVRIWTARVASALKSAWPCRRSEGHPAFGMGVEWVLALRRPAWVLVGEQERVELDGAATTAAAAAAAVSEAASDRAFIKRKEDAAGEMKPK